jgi:phosphonoacetaldehyde hydrolase
VKAVIVDWAGTIVDFGSSAPAGAFVELFRRHGISLTSAEARGPMGTNKRDHVAALLLGLPHVAAEWARQHGAPPTDADVGKLYEEFIPLQISVLADYADILPGTLEAFAELRQRGLKIGSTTGYNRQMIDVVLGVVRPKGLEPDCVVTSSDARGGRPSPWMALEAAAWLDAWPLSQVVKIGDTLADIDEGRNAGMWTIGLTRCGNEVGLGAEALAALERDRPVEAAARIDAARLRFIRHGASYTAPSLLACLPLLDEIEARIGRGERP